MSGTTKHLRCIHLCHTPPCAKGVLFAPLQTASVDARKPLESRATTARPTYEADSEEGGAEAAATAGNQYIACHMSSGLLGASQVGAGAILVARGGGADPGKVLGVSVSACSDGMHGTDCVAPDSITH
jgi:hypothetical protein